MAECGRQAGRAEMVREAERFREAEYRICVLRSRRSHEAPAGRAAGAALGGAGPLHRSAGYWSSDTGGMRGTA